MGNHKGITRNVGLATLALAFMTMSRDASAIERKGFIIGVGVGGGSMGCDGCKSTSGVAAAFHVGGMLTEKVALVLDSSGISRSEDGGTLSSVVAGPAVQFWHSPRVWVKGGVGGGFLQASYDKVTVTSDAGLGFMGGLGVDVLQKKKFTIDLQFRVTTAKIEGDRYNNVFGLVGFNFY
ncbi:MAG: outer membrane beta-barrel protein [Vicinamibacteria bacterium]|nr:outer membrane beta-barrel protein [Vicinamibacteria bacterium]